MSSQGLRILLEAFDGDKTVVVTTSQEAIDDFGTPAIENKASEKYDAQQLEPNGSVLVYTSDLKR